MVKVNGPLFCLNAIGKLGDNVYSRNQYGANVYSPKAYVYSGSTEQLLWRAALTYLISYWENDTLLTDAQRQMWVELAQEIPGKSYYGNRINLAGRDWFVKLNIFRRRAGLGVHKTPPVRSSCSYYPTVSFSQDSSGVWATLDPLLTGDELFSCSTVVNQSLQRKFLPHLTKFAGIFKSTDSSPFLVIPNADLTWATSRQFFRYRAIDGNGCASTPQHDFLDCGQGSLYPIQYPTGDSSIISYAPTTNYSTDPLLYLTDFSGSYKKALLQFDLSGIPLGEVCTAATLWLYFSSVSASALIQVHYGLVPFTITECTWNEASTGVNWSTPGGAAGTDYSSAVIASTTVSTTATWYSFNLRAFVNYFLAGTLPNHGLWLTVSGTCDDTAFSNDFITPSLRPYLEITF